MLDDPASFAACELCRARRKRRGKRGYSDVQLEVLRTRTGLSGEVFNGKPIVDAVFRPFIGPAIRLFGAGVRVAPSTIVEWEFPIFMCPWSLLPDPPILGHGPAVRVPNGAGSHEWARGPDGRFVPESRCSHCRPYRPQGEYLIRPAFHPAFPRRRVR
jgi:hypothetical protein